MTSVEEGDSFRDLIIAGVLALKQAAAVISSFALKDKL